MDAYQLLVMAVKSNTFLQKVVVAEDIHVPVILTARAKGENEICSGS